MGTPEKSVGSLLYAVCWATSVEADELTLVHGVDRIEALGADAVVVGSDGRNLHFTSVRLGDRQTPRREPFRRDEAQYIEGFFRSRPVVLIVRGKPTTIIRRKHFSRLEMLTCETRFYRCPVRR